MTISSDCLEESWGTDKRVPGNFGTTLYIDGYGHGSKGVVAACIPSLLIP